MVFNYVKENGGRVAMEELCAALGSDAKHLNPVVTGLGVKGERRTPEEMEKILEERRKSWVPKPRKYKAGALRLFAEHAASPMEGAYLKFED